jgi:hypothetical protein
MFFSYFVCTNLMADDVLIIDDRRTGDLESVAGGSWRMVTDGVMGGVSSGELSLETIDNKACLRLRGDVRLENNGGFIQAALEVEDTEAADASDYHGVLLSFGAPDRWQTVRLPFAEFVGYRIGKKLDLKRLERIGLVAIGRAFAADLCIGELALYKDSY